jgi:hypothetical protein
MIARERIDGGRPTRAYVLLLQNELMRVFRQHAVPVCLLEAIVLQSPILPNFKNAKTEPKEKG